MSNMIYWYKIDKGSFISPFRGLGKGLLIIVLIFTLVLDAQNLFIDAEIRPRTEYQDGYKTPILVTNDPGFFTSQRTRLGLTFSSDLLTTQITVQDARVFGQYSNTDVTASTSIYEAWADMVLFPGASLKLGRQLIKYDDSRLFSSPAWNITGTAHDLALLKYSINEYQAHIGLAYNNKSETATEVFYVPGSKYRSMVFLWLSTPIVSGFTLSGIVINEGLQDTLGLGGVVNYKKVKMVQTITYGGNLKYESADFPLSGLATAYFQGGQSITDKILGGRLLAMRLNYNLTKAISVNVGTDYISGDSNGTSDGIQSNFKKLYGADHTFNGYMDYWNTPLTTGLLDYYGGATAKIGKDLTLEGGYHIFNTEYAGKNKKSIAYNKNIGSEFDFLIIYKLNSWATIQGGYCTYFSNNNTLIAKDMVSNANVIPKVRAQQWAYVMFTIKIPPTPKRV
jgi:hypothetical protein